MADFFYDGMPNVNERLNQLHTAFAAGPYGALPSTGGTLSGPLMIDVASGNALLTLAAGDFVGTGPAISGYRKGIFLFALGTESVVRGGSSNDLTFDSLNNAIKFYSGQSAGADPLAMLMDGEKIYMARDVVPRTDNARSLGSAALAYSVVYARTGTINTSDARLKCDFRDLSLAEVAAARDLARAIGIYRWRDAVDCKGDAARQHIGPTVQYAIEIMRAHQLDPFGYGFICHDKWEQQIVEHPATEVRAAWAEVTLEAGDRYAFRYDELAMFIAAGQEARLAALECK